MWKNTQTNEIVIALPKLSSDGTNLYSLRLYSDIVTEDTTTTVVDEEGVSHEITSTTVVSKTDNGWDYTALESHGWINFEIPTYDENTQYLDGFDVKDKTEEMLTAELNNVKIMRTTDVTTKRKDPSTLEVNHVVDTVNYLIHADDKTFNNITGFLKRLILNGSVTKNNWYFDDGKSLLVDAAQTATILNLVADRQQFVRDVAATHINAINALTTRAEVVAYDITTGWS